MTDERTAPSLIAWLDYKTDGMSAYFSSAAEGVRSLGIPPIGWAGTAAVLTAVVSWSMLQGSRTYDEVVPGGRDNFAHNLGVGLARVATSFAMAAVAWSSTLAYQGYSMDILGSSPTPITVNKALQTPRVTKDLPVKSRVSRLIPAVP